MRKPRSPNHSQLAKKKRTRNLDPTTNNELHLKIWSQLVRRLKTSTTSNPAPAAPQREQMDNLSEERTFGKNVRRLVKLVHQAVLNPGE